MGVDGASGLPSQDDQCRLRLDVRQPGGLPDQPDFILDQALPYEEAVYECTSRGGRVLSVNANAISYDEDDVRRGHEVDTPEQD